jgi:hypothetical protein
MNIRGIRQLAFLLFTAGIAIIMPNLSNAAPFFFPDMNPSFVKVDSPEWLQEGRGNDGYLTISSEVIPVNTCTQMSSHSFWGGQIKLSLFYRLLPMGLRASLIKWKSP